ncbi:MAG: oligosaccharide flippase family protein [bacterium]
MKTSTKVAKEATITFVGMGFGDAMRYLFTMLLARLVGVEYLGIYSLANSVTRLAEVFGKAGLDSGILRYVSMRQGTGDYLGIQQDVYSTLKLGLIFSLLVMSVQVLLSDWLISSVFHGSSLLQTVIIINAITLPFTVFTLIAAHATQGFKLLKYKVFVTNLLAPGVLLMTMIAAYFLISAEMAIILPTVVSAVVGFFVILGFLKQLTGVHFSQVLRVRFDLEILRFSYPLMFVAVIDTFMHWMDIIMLGYFTDTRTVGLYHPAARMAGLVRITLVALMSISGPMLSEFFAQKKQQEMSDLYKLVVRWIMTLTLPIAVLLVIFPYKTMLLFGGQYMQAATVLLVLTIATLIQSFTTVGGTTLTVTGYPKVNLINSVIVVVINVILNIVWIPVYGIMGAAYATLASMTILGVLRYVEVWYLVKMHPFCWKLLKPVMACVFTYLMLRMVKPYLMPFHTLVTLTLAAAITFLCFGAILWLLKFDADDREVTKALLMIRKSSKRI